MPVDVTNTNMFLILAEAARVTDNKVDLRGGGWSVINLHPTRTVTIVAVAIVRLPWTDTLPAYHHFSFSLHDADGKIVQLVGPDGQLAEVVGGLDCQLPMPAEAGAGMDQTLVIPDITLPELPLAVGMYELRAQIDNVSSDSWKVQFVVIDESDPAKSTYVGHTLEILRDSLGEPDSDDLSGIKRVSPSFVENTAGDVAAATALRAVRDAWTRDTWSFAQPDGSAFRVTVCLTDLDEPFPHSLITIVFQEPDGEPTVFSAWHLNSTAAPGTPATAALLGLVERLGVPIAFGVNTSKFLLQATADQPTLTPIGAAKGAEVRMLAVLAQIGTEEWPCHSVSVLTFRRT